MTVIEPHTTDKRFCKKENKWKSRSDRENPRCQHSTRRGGSISWSFWGTTRKASIIEYQMIYYGWTWFRLNSLDGTQAKKKDTDWKRTVRFENCHDDPWKGRITFDEYLWDSASKIDSLSYSQVIFNSWHIEYEPIDQLSAITKI
jgi:hypothetical protein